MDLNNDEKVFNLVRECMELVAQIVVQTRCTKGTGSRESLNLKTPYLEDLRAALFKWRSALFLPLHIRIFCTETAPNKTRSKVLLEAWKIALEDTKIPAGNAVHELRRNLVVVVRGIFSFLRLMPAFQLQRQLARLPNSGYTLEYAFADSAEQETWDEVLTCTKYLGAAPLLLKSKAPHSLKIQVTYRTSVSDLLQQPHIGEHVQDSYVVTSLPITIRTNDPDIPGSSYGSYGSYGSRKVGSQPRSIERPAPIYEHRPINPHSDGPVLVSTSSHTYSKPREIPQPEDELDLGTPSSSSFQERTGSFKADKLSGLKFSISPFRDASPIHFMPGPLTSSDMPVLESSPSSRTGSIRGGSSRRRSSASDHAPVNFASDATDDLFQFEGAPLPNPVDQFPFSSGQLRPPYPTGRADVFSTFEKPPSRSTAGLDRLSNSDTVKLEEFMQLMNSMPRTIEHAETTLEPFSGRFDTWS